LSAKVELGALEHARPQFGPLDNPWESTDSGPTPFQFLREFLLNPAAARARRNGKKQEKGQEKGQEKEEQHTLGTTFNFFPCPTYWLLPTACSNCFNTLASSGAALVTLSSTSPLCAPISV